MSRARVTWLGAGAALLLLAALAVVVAGNRLPGVELRQRDVALLHALSDTATAAPGARRLGQTFRSEHDNLSAVALYLQNFSFRLPPEGRFHLQAGDSPAAPEILSLPFSAADFRDNPYLVFRFPLQPDSAGRTYRVWIEASTPLAATLSVHLTRIDAYSAGAALIDAAAQPGDLEFRTFYTYTPTALARDVWDSLVSGWRLVLAGLAFLLLPGLVLAQLLGRGWTPGARLLAAPALTLFAWPVVLLVGWALHLDWGVAAAWLFVLAGVVGLAWMVYRREAAPGGPPALQLTPIPTRPAGLRRASAPVAAEHSGPSAATRLYWTLFAAILGVTLLSRLATLRDLVAGMGLDAYHHTLVTALFLDRGGVPHDYQPYAPLASFTYHFGFHAFAAALAWLAPGSLPVERLMVLAGQLATTLPVVTLPLFGRRVLGNRWVGLVAGALAGVVCIFPAFYVNWSRYTQGLGLALLPVAWVVLFDALTPPSGPGAARTPIHALTRRASGPLLLAALAVAGLFLTHYRIAGLFAGYAALFLGGVALAALRRATPGARLRALGPIAGGVVVVAGGAALVLLPWLLNLRANFVVRFAGSANPANAGYYDLRAMLGSVPLDYWSTAPLLVLAGLGLVWCLLRRDWPPVLLAVWFGLHLLWSNPTLLPLPGAGYLDTVTVATSGFIPVCLLAAYPLVGAGGWLLRGARRGPLADPAWRALVRAALLVAGALVVVLGAARLLPILDVRPYVTAQDMAGMAWLRANTPPTAVVAGNGFGQPWGPEAVQGSDAGLWVPVLAGRRGILPPIPAYNEQLADPGYLRHAAQIVRATAAPDLAESWTYLRQQGVTHLYIGSRGGVMDPEPLLALPEQVRLAFHQDDVWIFELLPPP